MMFLAGPNMYDPLFALLHGHFNVFIGLLQLQKICFTYVMEQITPEWLKERLDRKRGSRARLAEALGISPAKVSRMTTGDRRPQGSEILTILAFFGETTQSVDPELLELWRELTPQERVFLLNSARAQIAYRD